MESVKDKAILAKSGFIILSNAKTRDKNETLESMAKSLDKNRKRYLKLTSWIFWVQKAPSKGELTDALVKD